MIVRNHANIEYACEGKRKQEEEKICHCRTWISWLVVRGGTINFQIVKQEGEYTPQVPDTVTHVLLRTRRLSSFPPWNFIAERIQRKRS